MGRFSEGTAGHCLSGPIALKQTSPLGAHAPACVLMPRLPGAWPCSCLQRHNPASVLLCTPCTNALPCTARLRTCTCPTCYTSQPVKAPAAGQARCQQAHTPGSRQATVLRGSARAGGMPPRYPGAACSTGRPRSALRRRGAGRVVEAVQQAALGIHWVALQTAQHVPASRKSTRGKHALRAAQPETPAGEAARHCVTACDGACGRARG